jgi:hypothetical protein
VAEPPKAVPAGATGGSSHPHDADQPPTCLAFGRAQRLDEPVPAGVERVDPGAGWPMTDPPAREPAGVYQHTDGRPLLGRKLKGRSVRELRDLGLLVEDAPAADSDAR